MMDDGVMMAYGVMMADGEMMAGGMVMADGTMMDGGELSTRDAPTVLLGTLHFLF